LIIDIITNQSSHKTFRSDDDPMILDANSAMLIDDGDVSCEKESEMDVDLAKRCNLDDSEEISYSVTARWRERVRLLEGLVSQLKQWCLEVTPSVEGLDLLPPFVALGVDSKCSAAVIELKARWKLFLISRDEHIEALAALTEAKAALTEAKAALDNGQVEFAKTEADGHTHKNDIILKLLACAVTDKSGTVTDKAGAVADKAGAVADKAELIFKEAEQISNSHGEVKSLLSALKAGGNDTALATQLTEDNKSSITLPKDRFADDPHPSSPSKLDKLCELEPQINSNVLGLLATLDSKETKPILYFYEFLRCGFGKVSIKEESDEKRKLQIAQTVDAIVKWNAETPLEQCPALVAPYCVGDETEAVQPIMYAIMFKISQFLSGNGQQITSQQGIPRADNRPGRIVDFVVAPIQEYLFAILPAMLGIPIEVKPVKRKRVALNKLLLEAQTQLIGHLAKRAMFSFNFGGIGEDCQVFGLELTMGSVAVVMLELSGVGTAAVEVTTSRSMRMPLFDKETRMALFPGSVRLDVEESYDITDGDQNALPAGFDLLARTLKSVQLETGKASINDRSSRFTLRPKAKESPVQVDNYLGSGAFSHVLTLSNGDNNVFVKVPKSHRMKKSLECEVAALQNLAGHVNIPQLYDTENPVRTLDIKIRCEVSDLPCLPLRGLIGLSSNHTLRNCGALEGTCLSESPHCRMRHDVLKVIFNAVFDALKYAHDRGWAHLDVRPSNIITHVHGGGYHVMLIDWGCARSTKYKLKGFIGCPPYAHDGLFGLKTGWTPRLQHDLASLAYSVASLDTGSVPWPCFQNHRAVTDDAKSVRYQMTSECLNLLFDKWNLRPEIEDALRESIGSEKA
jgi:Protein kinase domain